MFAALSCGLYALFKLCHGRNGDNGAGFVQPHILTQGFIDAIGHRALMAAAELALRGRGINRLSGTFQLTLPSLKSQSQNLLSYRHACEPQSRVNAL